MSYQANEDSTNAPESVKTLGWAIGVGKLYWRWIIRPPVLAVVLIVGLLSYRLGTSIEAERVQTKDDLIITKQAQVDFLATELSAYKDRLHGASPDDAARKLASLETQLEHQQARLNVLAPETYRHLKPVQKESLRANIDRLKSAAPKLGGIMVSTEPVGDSESFALEIVEFLDKERRFMTGPLTGGSCGENERGITVAVKNPDDPPPGAKDVLSVFADAGLQPSYGTLDGVLRETAPFVIFVCRSRL